MEHLLEIQKKILPALPLRVIDVVLNNSSLIIESEKFQLCLTSNIAWRITQDGLHIFGDTDDFPEKVKNIMGYNIVNLTPQSSVTNMDFALHFSNGTIFETFSVNRKSQTWEVIMKM